MAESMPFGVEPREPVVFAGAAFMITVVGPARPLGAGVSGIPARPGARADPDLTPENARCPQLLPGPQRRERVGLCRAPGRHQTREQSHARQQEARDTEHGRVACIDADEKTGGESGQAGLELTRFRAQVTASLLGPVSARPSPGQAGCRRLAVTTRRLFLSARVFTLVRTALGAAPCRSGRTHSDARG